MYNIKIKIFIIYLFYNLFPMIMMSKPQDTLYTQQSNQIEDVFLNFTYPETPKIFYDYYHQEKYFSKENNDSMYFFPSAGGLTFDVYLCVDIITKEIYHKIYRVNYNDFDFQLELKVKPNEVWEACENSIISEIPNWKLKHIKYLRRTCYLVVISFIYNDTLPARNYLYIPLD